MGSGALGGVRSGGGARGFFLKKQKTNRAKCTIPKQAAKNINNQKIPKNTFIATVYHSSLRGKIRGKAKGKGLLSKHVHRIGGASLCRACVFPCSFTHSKLPSEKPRAPRPACLYEERFCFPQRSRLWGKNIIIRRFAYHRGMKKLKRTFFVVITLLVGYCLAFAFCLRALNAPVAVSVQAAKLSVVIDAGHGGVDGGVVGVSTKRKESDVNLAIAFMLKEKLADAGFLVVMTRTTEGGLYDTTAPGFKRRDMQKRKEICESANPLCVLSVHQNFYPSTASRGGQVFYRKDDEWSTRLAGNIQAELNTLYKGEGVKARKEMAGDYYMLRLTPPSVIVECGFLSNPKDDALLNSSAFCEKIADSIVVGLLATIKNTVNTVNVG